MILTFYHVVLQFTIRRIFHSQSKKCYGFLKKGEGYLQQVQCRKINKSLMPGSSRYASEILNEIERTFSDVEVKIFRNPLTFSTAEPFLEYTRASLSEDRRLWGDFFTEKESFNKVMKSIEQVANKWITRDGKIVMTKVVGGFIAIK